VASAKFKRRVKPSLSLLSYHVNNRILVALAKVFHRLQNTIESQKVHRPTTRTCCDYSAVCDTKWQANNAGLTNDHIGIEDTMRVKAAKHSGRPKRGECEKRSG
jgi:hypothetical protein